MAVFPSPSTEDTLLYLQTLVARRADVLRLGFGGARGRDLECWLQAERDVFEGRLTPAAPIVR